MSRRFGPVGPLVDGLSPQRVMPMFRRLVHSLPVRRPLGRTLCPFPLCSLLRRRIAFTNILHPAVGTHGDKVLQPEFLPTYRSSLRKPGNPRPWPPPALRVLLQPFEELRPQAEAPAQANLCPSNLPLGIFETAWLYLQVKFRQLSQIYTSHR